MKSAYNIITDGKSSLLQPKKDKINWDWVLENMRHCPKCNCYKVLDYFEGKKGKCKSCAFNFKKKVIVAPEPKMLASEAELQLSINKGLTGSSKFKIKLRPIISKQ